MCKLEICNDNFLSAPSALFCAQPNKFNCILFKMKNVLRISFRTEKFEI